MTAVIVGLVFIIIGGAGLFRWSQEFFFLLRGLGPLSIFVGGVVAFISGVASFRPFRVNEKKKE